MVEQIKTHKNKGLVPLLGTILLQVLFSAMPDRDVALGAGCFSGKCCFLAQADQR